MASAVGTDAESMGIDAAGYAISRAQPLAPRRLRAPAARGEVRRAPPRRADDAARRRPRGRERVHARAGPAEARAAPQARANAREHLAFGGGTHHCLGMHLARMEAQEALGALVVRTRSLELAYEEIEWGASLFRVQGKLPMRLGA